MQIPARDRHEDLNKHLPSVTSIHESRFFKLFRDGCHITGNHQGGKRQIACRLQEDQAPICIDQARFDQRSYTGTTVANAGINKVAYRME